MGAIGVGFKSPLIIFTENVNGRVYLDKLNSPGIFDFADDAYGERNYHLVQDGASCHWTEDVFAGLLDKCNIFST